MNPMTRKKRNNFIIFVVLNMQIHTQRNWFFFTIAPVGVCIHLRGFFIHLNFTHMKHLIDNENTSMTFGREERECIVTMEDKKSKKTITINLDREDLYNVIGRLLFIQSQVREGGDNDK